MEDGSLLFIILSLKGGGGPCNSINFNNMDQAIIKNFSPDAPDYRTINKGLNFEGICKTMKCSAYNKKVWIPKGYGNFSVNKEVYKS